MGEQVLVGGTARAEPAGAGLQEENVPTACISLLP